ncbi:MAG: AbrB/MazE/SpoVT family DNA-binding domain-containing protein [Chloroflexi bacterium]|nr:AbrB/MazE/SpoVT family DNA-binding domain-containing protein [Chloroflexota bacterium]
MNDLIELSLDKLGRILIPDSLRRRLSLAPGMVLIVEKGEGGGLRLRLQTPQPALVDKRGILVVKAEPTSDLSDLTRRERDQRLFTLLQRTGL